MEPVSEKLKKPRRPWLIAVVTVAAVAVAGGAIVGVTALHGALTPTPTPTAVFVPAAQTGSVNRAQPVSDEEEQQALDAIAAVEKQQADAAAAAQAAAQAAAEQAAQEASKKNTSQHADGGGSSGLPAGAPVPPIPGTDSPDTTRCASGTASTVNGVPVCD